MNFYCNRIELQTTTLANLQGWDQVSKTNDWRNSHISYNNIRNQINWKKQSNQFSQNQRYSGNFYNSK